MHFNPAIPEPLVYLIGGLLGLLTAFLYWREAKRLSGFQNGLLLLFRLIALLAIVFLLLQPSQREKVEHSIPTGLTVVGIDASRSMEHEDDGDSTRLERVRELLEDAGLTDAPTSAEKDTLRFYRFDETAQPLTRAEVETLEPDGETTRMHSSLESLIGDLPDQEINALVLFSDGHDFELAGISKTALLAKRRRFPIYAVPVGSTGKVRDVAVRIANYQPYAYVRQKAAITGILRVIGADYENVTVQLLRDGDLLETRQLATGEEAELRVSFEVSEEEPGQYPYTLKVLPLARETDPNNNEAVTYLNVINEKIRGLILEGEPHWDTTFLQRSLYRNDKIDLDCLSSVSSAQGHRLRNSAERGELAAPTSVEDLAAYDLIILGRHINRVSPTVDGKLLRHYVEEEGGILVMARVFPLEGADAVMNGLEPVNWAVGGNSDLNFHIARDGRALPAFRAIEERQRSNQALPQLPGATRVLSVKPLTSVLAEAEDPDTGQRYPAIVHRRSGRGQILAIGIDGLWKWNFDADAATPGESLFARFWDQTLVWLLSQSEKVPGRGVSFRASTANLALGEKITFGLSRAKDSDVGAARNAIIFHEEEDAPLARVSLTAPDESAHSMVGEFLPERTGRYRAELGLSDGSRAMVRFMVFDEQPELTEVAADLSYLRKLAASTGGRILEADELAALLERVASPREMTEAQYDYTPIWNESWVYYLIGALLGLDWYLRRRWGLS